VIPKTSNEAEMQQCNFITNGTKRSTQS